MLLFQNTRDEQPSTSSGGTQEINRLPLRSQIIELEELKKEISRRKNELKELRIREKNLEQSVISYLNERNHAGVKYNGNAILLQEKKLRKKKKKADREAEVINLLSQEGIDPDKCKLMVKNIMEGIKGEQTIEKGVSIRALTN